MKLVQDTETSGSIIDISNEEINLLLTLLSERYKAIYLIAGIPDDAYQKVCVETALMAGYDITMSEKEIADLMASQKEIAASQTTILYNFFKENNLLEYIS